MVLTPKKEVTRFFYNNLFYRKEFNVLKSVPETLLNIFRDVQHNYTIFQLGKATLLQVSDAMQLKKADVFNPDGTIKTNTFSRDQKKVKLIPSISNQFTIIYWLIMIGFSLNSLPRTPYCHIIEK